MLISYAAKRKQRNLYWSFIAGILFSVLLQFLLFVLIFLNYENVRNYALSKGYLGVGHYSMSQHVKGAPENIISGVFDRNDIETWVIDIKFKQYDKLRKKVEESRANGFIQQTGDDWVKATIKNSRSTHKVKLRIKGDNLDHLQGNKWSFRVRSETSIDGIRQFNIQNPMVRGFYGTKILEKLRKHYGLIATKTDFKRIIINGKDIGLMQIEEHFGKELLERNKRKDTVIIKFDEQNRWDYGEFYNFNNVHIDTFGTSKVASEHVKWDMYTFAWELLNDFVNNRKPASIVFDCASTGRYLALNRLLGTNHGHRWGNLRFYFNPYQERLEIIGFDDNFQERASSDTSQKDFFDDELISKIWTDEQIQECYQTAAFEIVSDFKNQKFLSNLNESIVESHVALKSEFFLLPKFSIKDLIIDPEKAFPFLMANNNTDYLIKTEEAEYVSGPPVLLSYDPIRNRSVVRNLLAQKIDLERLEASEDSQTWKELPIPNTVLGPLAQIELLHDRVNPSRYKKLKLFLKLEQRAFTVESRIAPAHTTTELQSAEREDTALLKRYGELDNDVFIFNSGTIEIHNTLKFHEKKVIIQPDTVLNFQSGAGLDLYGNTELTGGGKIIGNGVDSGWLVLDANQSYATISELTFENPGLISKRKNWFTGSLMLHNSSNLSVNELTIKNVNNEDALNIVNSNFMITNLYVDNTKSDALDIDFSEGRVLKSIFKDIGYMSGADAIDLSGSEVEISNVEILNVSDKGFSIGENSVATITDSKVTNALVGLAAKDGSSVGTTKTIFENILLADIMAYIKKDQYNKASVKVGKSSQGLTLICDKKSSIVTDRGSCEARDMNVDELYQTFMKTSRVK